MSKTNTRIEIVSSGLTQLSSMSAPSRQAIFGLLKKHYTDVRITLVDNEADLQALVDRRPDLVFLGMKFIPVHPELGANDENKLWISQYLTLHGVAHTGSNYQAHQLELNKQLAKQRVLEAGLASSPYRLVAQSSSAVTLQSNLKFPLFVKPSNRGGGAGIASDSLIFNQSQLNEKVAAISRELQSDSLVEEFLPGREFSVAILESEDSGELRAMPIELVAGADASGLRILSEAMKTSNEEVVLPVTGTVVRAAICDLAIDSFRALGARHYGRIDIKCNGAGVPHFLEANLLPSLIRDYGSFPKAAQLNANLSYEDIILSIVSLAMITHETDTVKLLEFANPLSNAVAAL